MSIQKQQTLSVPAVALVPVLLAALMTIAIPVQAQTYSVLHNFTGGQGDGGGPYAGLTMDRAGNFYGAAFCGGIGGDCLGGNGTVFKLTHAGSGWVLSTLYKFQGGEDGVEADGAVTIGPDGALYGTTFQGGGNGCYGLGCGIVYRLTPPATVCRAVSCPWTETVLHRFGLVHGDGTLPVYGAPLFDRAGNLYGTTKEGGTFGYGTVYELTPTSGGWTEKILWNFGGGEYPGQPVNSLIFDAAGNLYGTTLVGGGVYNFGTVFELSPSGSVWTETTLFTFQNNTGNEPAGGLAWDAQGNLYGTTEFGGPLDGGTVFQLAPSGSGWSYTQLAYFAAESGGPTDTPTLDASGNVYVTVYDNDYEGSVVKLTQSNGTWSSTVLHEFQGSDGSFPVGSVVLDANGNVYGTTFVGGSDNAGVIFEITP